MRLVGVIDQVERQLAGPTSGKVDVRLIPALHSAGGPAVRLRQLVFVRVEHALDPLVGHKVDKRSFGDLTPLGFLSHRLVSYSPFVLWGGGAAAPPPPHL